MAIPVMQQGGAGSARRSPLASGLGTRLAAVLAVSALLWLGVVWALS